MPGGVPRGGEVWCSVSEGAESIQGTHDSCLLPSVPRDIPACPRIWQAQDRHEWQV